MTLWGFVRGIKGDKGDTGDTGLQGEQGIQGIQGIPGAGQYVHRGALGANDFTQATLTRDGNWHELNLSSKVSEDAIVAHIVIRMVDADVGSYFFMAPTGYTPIYNYSSVRTQVSNMYTDGEFIIKLDATKKVQYKSFANLDGIMLNVAGYWLE